MDSVKFDIMFGEKWRKKSGQCFILNFKKMEFVHLSGYKEREYVTTQVFNPS